MDFTQQGPVTPVDPVASQYAVQAAARRMGPKPVKFTGGVAGGPPPPIPRLDGPPPDGSMTMAGMAAHQRGPAPAALGALFQGAPQVPPPPAGFPVPGARVMPAPQAQIPPQAPVMHQAPQRPAVSLLPDDLLPETALADPGFKPGINARQALGQPELAYRYGVIRAGQFIPPQKLVTGKAGPSPETLESLQHIAKFNEERKAQELAAQDAEAERQASQGAAGAAAKLSGTTGVQDPTRPEVRVDAFDLQRVREMQLEDLLNNDEQREIIEAQCVPMSLSELVLNGRVKQVVPISPGVLEPEGMPWGDRRGAVAPAVAISRAAPRRPRSGARLPRSGR